MELLLMALEKNKQFKYARQPNSVPNVTEEKKKRKERKK
jgi:hypothetical protein